LQARRNSRQSRPPIAEIAARLHLKLVHDKRLLPAEPFWISNAEQAPPTILKEWQLRNVDALPTYLTGTKQNASRGEDVWIYQPWLDLVVGCGAWSVPLLLLAYFSSAASTLTWSIVFYVLALFFNYPHYMATIYRAYHTQEDFRKYRIFTVHITLLVALTIILSHFWFGALPWLFTVYLTASPWHYSGQNYGLFMMFARRAGAQPTSLERRALHAAFLLSYAVLLLNFHTGLSADPLFISLNIPEVISSRAQVVLAIAFVACSAFGLSRLTAQAGLRRMVPSFTLFSTQCVWFLVPTLLSLLQRFQVPQSRYSTGVLAVMHSAQYLWITSYYAKREAATAPGRPWRPFVYFTILIVGGIALFIPGPWLSSLVFHFDFTRSFLLFTALVNIHHFILDGAIWKLRDGRIAALLVNSAAQIAEGAIEARSRTMTALRWLAGPNSAARALRVGTALTLLAWGCVDQVHYYFALHNGNLADLKRAASLAPYDTTLEMRLARQALEEGNPQDSVAAWQYAIKANPADPAPRDAWLRYLTQEKRLSEAYQLTGSWLKFAPKDAALLVNHGILAQQSGHIDEAELSWQKALMLDPSQADADLYLATDLEKQSKIEDAIGHYEDFLTKVVQRPASKLPPAATLISVALKLAECNTRANHPDLALRYYKMARTLATKTGEKKLESFADVAEASLQAKLGQTTETLHLYQRALQLDAGLDDHHSEAVDWYMYAMFLRDAGFPARFVYASLLKSQSLFSSDSNSEEVAAASRTCKELEQQLGPQASAISRNPEPLWHEALELKR
jgi:tetratricopeptide (TPR) repeat protein